MTEGDLPLCPPQKWHHTNYCAVAQADGGLEITMYKLQMKLQRIISYLCLAATALTFIYSLGLSTDVYFLYRLESLDGIVIPGAEMFYELQPFNKQFTTYSIALLLLAVAGLIFNNHTRRKYYVANYLTVGASSVANIALGTWALTNVLHYKDLFNAIDFSVIASIVDSVPPAVLISKGVDPENLAGPYSTLWFDLVIPVFIILTLVTLLNVANAVFKTVLMSKEKQLLKEGA